MGNEFASTNDTRPNPPHKLRWYQFSLRSMFVVMTLFALGLGLYIKYVKQVEERRVRTQYVQQALMNITKSALWTKDKNVIKDGFTFGYDGDQTGFRGSGEIKFLLKNPSGNEPVECVAAVTAYLKEQDIFAEPQRVEISENKSTLTSTEGWLKLEAKLIPRQIPYSEFPKELQLNWELNFQPLHPPSEKQKVPANSK